MTLKQQQIGEALLKRVSEYLPPKGVGLVRDALEFAIECHDGQFRRSGDPVITHPLHAAETCAALQLDAGTVAGALLHDVQEDCDISNEEMGRATQGFSLPGMM